MRREEPHKQRPVNRHLPQDPLRGRLRRRGRRTHRLVINDQHLAVRHQQPVDLPRIVPAPKLTAQRDLWEARLDRLDAFVMDVMKERGK